MPARSIIIRLIVGAAGCAAAVCLLLYAQSSGEQVSGKSPTAQVQPKPTKGKYLGASYCSLCHKNGPVATFNDDYVLLTEYQTWVEKDKHSKAYKALTDPRSKQIGMLMGIDDVTKDARCLNCHCANVPRELREEAEGQAYKIEEGVSCDACHGPSSNWIVPHSLQPWRKKPMAEKEALGMTDVRDPAKRSRLCYSCHIGNALESKLVTHEMYAAGHPPLPSIEVATFSEKMPLHWRYMAEKKPVIRDLLKDNPREMERTKLTVISGAVALEAAMDLLADQAQIGVKNPNRDKGWPELSQFDCYACHHDLRVRSWRQSRGYFGRPGRPQMRPWPLVLVKLGTRHAGLEPNELTKIQKQLQDALDASPFGKPEALIPAARRAAEWSRQLSKTLASREYDQAAAKKLLLDLCSLARDEVSDYDSARQFAWAFEVIYRELDPKPASDSEIRKTMETLDKSLNLSLPSGTGREILKELGDNLRKISDYDPDQFKKSFGRLSQLLAGN